MTFKTLKICLQFSLSLCFLLLLHIETANAQFSQADAIVEKNKAQYGNNVSVLAWRGDSLLYKKETGDFNINTQLPLGAASSWLTAALVMHFVDLGKISLDDRVSEYLPVFKKYSKGYLTIRHCLTHTTGLEVEKGGIQKVFQKTKFATLEEEVNAFAAKREIISNPGEEMYYSNIGINIVGRVLEVVGKKGFDRLVAEKITRPIGMKKTTFGSEYAVNPHSGALTTSADFVKFLTMMLNKGTYKGKKILSEQSVLQLQEIIKTAAKQSFSPQAAAGYEQSLGSWVEMGSDGKASVFVAPGIFGSWAYMDTCRNYACVVMVKNTSKEDKREMYLEIKDALDAVVPCN